MTSQKYGQIVPTPHGSILHHTKPSQKSYNAKNRFLGTSNNIPYYSYYSYRRLVNLSGQVRGAQTVGSQTARISDECSPASKPVCPDPVGSQTIGSQTNASPAPKLVPSRPCRIPDCRIRDCKIADCGIPGECFSSSKIGSVD